MNCAICLGYLREKNKCPGCHNIDTLRIRCRILKCTERKGKYCFSCDKFPCARLKQLDKRYRTKYKMSMIENLQNIKNFGIRKFVRNEKEKWICTDCGGIICIHRGYCFNYGKVKK